jgi:hypothetical protein
LRKVLYILHRYPQISETYMETELRALDGRFELKVLSTGDPDLTYERHHPYTLARDLPVLIAAAREFRPDVIHGHYTHMIPAMAAVARAVDRPFTVRTHSFDVFGPAARELAQHRDMVNSSLCAGVLGFPPALRRFERAGWDMAKVRDCYPVIEYDWFYDRGPNGDAIMNVGACIPKKNMEDFVRLGAAVPGRAFNLYALGYFKGRIEALNEAMGRPIHIHPPVQPHLMPAEYKKHTWLVYTGTPKLPTVGWPLAVAEAQAAGVGVCMQRVRDDLAEYLGGAGYLFDTVAEASEIISGPVPAEMREAGFQQAARSDIHTHIGRLVTLWRQAY